MESAKKRETIVTALLAAGILLFLLMIGISNLFHFNFRMNSDTAADAIYGKLVWETKEIVPDGWYIATETQIICTPNLAALFYGLTHNMVLSEGLACCTMTALILISVLYFGKVLRFQRKERLLFAFLCLMLPADYILLELSYLFASYYAIHVIILFFTLSVYLEGLRDKSIKWAKLAAGLLFALLLGLQGVRGILVIYGPLFGMMVIYNLYGIYCGKKKEKSDILISLWAAALLVVSFLGTFYPRSVGQDLSRNIRNGFHKLFTVVMPDMARAIGFDDSQPVLVRICTLLLFLTTIFWLLQLLYRMCRKEEVKTEEWGGLILLSSPVVSALILAFTTVESTKRYCFLFTYAMAYVTVLFYRKIGQDKKLLYGLRSSVGIIIALLAVERLLHIYLPVLKAEEPPQSESYEVVRFLEENDFPISYSTFENANKMTVLSNGKIRVAAVATVEHMDVCKWVSYADWYAPAIPYETRTAYIISESEMENFEKFLAVHEDDLQLETQIGRYYIYSSDYNFSCLEIE